MDPLAARILRTIRRHELLPPGARVAVAVSGGSDSVALLHLLVALQAGGGFRVAGLAHVHHGLRGASADADERFCRAMAESLALPAIVERVDVRTRAMRERRSLEDAARTMRYEALARAARALGADRIAVGHTRDDQAETVLLKLLRGAGTGGLAGIHPRRGAVVRPLIDSARDELRAWLDAHGIRFVEDETNTDVSLKRNAVRHRLMPVLREHFGPSVAGALARHADVAREDDSTLSEAAAAISSRAMETGPTEVSLDWRALSDVPPAMRRRVVRTALHAAGVREPGLDHVLAAVELAEAAGAGAALPGGVRASFRAGRLVLTRPGLTDRTGASFSYALSVPGSVWIPEAGRRLDVRLAGSEAPEAVGRLAAPGPGSAVVSADGLDASLTVRSWRAGDRLRPLGLGGRRKKLQDLFTDRKVPPAERHRLPLVVDADGRIVWVPGHAIDEAYRVTEGTRAVLLLTMSESGGAG